MASNLHLLVFSSLFISIYGYDSIILPVTKDSKTLKYTTDIDLGTPSVSKKLVVDLEGPFLWTDCESGHISISSSYYPARCFSLQCSTANANTCRSKSCLLSSKNTVTGKRLNGELGEDTITFQSHSSIDNFLFSCAPAFLLQGLPSGAKGILGLGRNRISLPSQLNRKFSLCLPSSSNSEGAIFFDREVSKSLLYTPLLSKPVNNAGAVAPQDQSQSDIEYYIGVRSIRINGRKLSINEDNITGTRLSTIVPYTTLESSIYGIFTKAFIQAATESFNMTRVAPVAPFEICFSSKRDEDPVMPVIDLVLQSHMVKWRIHGGNSMVQVSDEVMCLGFLNGGLRAMNSIVVGGHQLENNLLDFDLAGSRFGFSSLSEGTIDCSNLNFFGESSSSS